MLRAILTIAAFVLAIAALHAQESGEQDQQQAPPAYAAPEQTPAQTPSVPLGGEDIVKPDWNKPKCEGPQNHDEADLCQQVRMAAAAEDSVFWARLQFIIAF